MMPTRRLVRIVVHNTVRNRREFAVLAFGVIVGVAAFVFILGLSMGARNKVLDLFPLERVEVVAPRASMLGGIVDFTKRLDDSTVEAIKKQKVVAVNTVIPRMALAFPAMVSGYFDGSQLSLEFPGDGIDASYLQDDPKLRDEFKDWEAEDSPDQLRQCGPPPRYICEGLYYCDRTDMKCHHRVPVIVSRALLEIYNKQFAKSRGLPVIGAMEEFIVQRGGLGKMRLYIDLGKSIVSIGNVKMKAQPRRVEGVLLGISDKAVPIGATVPMQYIQRWNREYISDEAAGTYSSIIVILKNKDDVAKFGSWLMKEMDLRLEDSQGEQFSLIITIVTAILLMVAFVIMLISAITIAHSFFMQVSERRREIGLLRAVGATRADVRSIIVGEAALLGLIAGIVGVGVGVAMGLVAEPALASRIPYFHFESGTLFRFDWWILVLGLVVAVLFAVVGGYLPARKASRMQPAMALAQQ